MTARFSSLKPTRDRERVCLFCCDSIKTTVQDVCLGKPPDGVTDFEFAQAGRSVFDKLYNFMSFAIARPLDSGSALENSET